MVFDDPATAGAQSVRVWDLPVRLFHWSLVFLLGFSWWSGEQHEMEWHRLSGYAILGLVVFRIYWGFFGGRTARFAQFLRGPRAAVAYARALKKGPYSATPGHNPIGGWSVIALLASILAMVTAGLFAVDVDGLESGPLADYLSFDQGRLAANVHAIVFYGLLVLAVIHLLAILYYMFGLRRDLLSPMITGRQRVGGDTPAQDLSASPWKAAIGVVLAAAAVYAIARGFRF
jgi:cytochrome b